MPVVSDSKSSNERVVSILQEQTGEVPLRRYLKGNERKTDLDVDEWINPIGEADGKLSLSFSSAEGAHYVSYSPDIGFVAVYSGPHGPENRPAKIDRENIAQLLNHAGTIVVLPTEDTPFNDVAVADLL